MVVETLNVNSYPPCKYFILLLKNEIKKTKTTPTTNPKQSCSNMSWLWLNIFLEAVFVGVYCVVLFLLITAGGLLGGGGGLTLGFLFWLGFLKHFLGYWLGLHSLYCKYGAACNPNILRETNVWMTHKMTSIMQRLMKDNISFYVWLLVECVLEGIAFVLVGSVLMMWIFKRRLVVVFMIGFILHLLAEVLGLHSLFCLRCE